MYLYYYRSIRSRETHQNSESEMHTMRSDSKQQRMASGCNPHGQGSASEELTAEMQTVVGNDSDEWQPNQGGN
jgi:UDP-N-acetylglucosamine 2-epimerase